MPYELIEKNRPFFAFADIQTGNFFECQERWYLKLEESTSQEMGTWNSFCLNDNSYIFFDKDEPVYEIYLEIKEV